MKKTIKENIIDCLSLGLKNGGIRYNQSSGVSIARIRNWCYSNNIAEKGNASFKSHFRKGISALEEETCMEKINVQRYKVNRKKLAEINALAKKNVAQLKGASKPDRKAKLVKKTSVRKKVLKKKIVKRVSKPLKKKASTKAGAKKMTLKKSPKKLLKTKSVAKKLVKVGRKSRTSVGSHVAK